MNRQLNLNFNGSKLIKDDIVYDFTFCWYLFFSLLLDFEFQNKSYFRILIWPDVRTCTYDPKESSRTEYRYGRTSTIHCASTYVLVFSATQLFWIVRTRMYLKQNQDSEIQDLF